MLYFLANVLIPLLCCSSWCIQQILKISLQDPPEPRPLACAFTDKFEQPEIQQRIRLIQSTLASLWKARANSFGVIVEAPFVFAT